MVYSLHIDFSLWMRICSCDLDNDVHYFYVSCDTKFAYGIYRELYLSV